MTLAACGAGVVPQVIASGAAAVVCCHVSCSLVLQLRIQSLSLWVFYKLAVVCQALVCASEYEFASQTACSWYWLLVG